MLVVAFGMALGPFKPSGACASAIFLQWEVGWGCGGVECALADASQLHCIASSLYREFSEPSWREALSLETRSQPRALTAPRTSQQVPALCGALRATRSHGGGSDRSHGGATRCHGRDHGADDHGADDHGAGDHGADDHGADDHGADDHGHGDRVRDRQAEHHGDGPR